jgi:flagellar M-ring protein FliF
MAVSQESVVEMWRGMDRGVKFVLFGGAVLALSALIWGAFILLREEYKPLFSQLSSGDAASIVEELKRQKIPYRISGGGSTVEVPAESVHETRLALMSSNVPLSGGVGFEIFDKQGLGATEQSQRVSFQRALQGELARTIATLENVKQARVHLVLPESSLFKRDKQEATAAVTVTMQPGNVLERQQIIGVQRLVAASVSGLDPARVVITDQRGVTLSSSDTAGAGAGAVEGRLEIQQQIEAHLARKVSQLLDSAFGPGQAIISVNVALRFDAIKTTTQSLLPMRDTSGGLDNAIVRRRQVISGTGSDAPAEETDGIASETRRSQSTTEVEYEYGRRVEEVIAAPGAIRRITVGVIVPPRVDEAQRIRLLELVAVAAGIDQTRGDLISVQALGEMQAVESSESLRGEPLANSNETDAVESVPADSTKQTTTISLERVGLVVLVALILGLVAVIVFRGRGSRKLSDAERERLLREIRQALGEDSKVTPLQVKQ